MKVSLSAKCISLIIIICKLIKLIIMIPSNCYDTIWYMRKRKESSVLFSLVILEKDRGMGIM